MNYAPSIPQSDRSSKKSREVSPIERNRGERRARFTKESDRDALSGQQKRNRSRGKLHSVARPFVKLRQLTNAWRAVYNYFAGRRRPVKKLLNPSALLYRAPGRKCDNERDSETSMRGFCIGVMSVFACSSRAALDETRLRLGTRSEPRGPRDLENSRIHGFTLITRESASRAHLIGLMIFPFHKDCVLNRCDTFA